MAAMPGKKPIEQVKEYDPNLDGAVGMSREKSAKGTSKRNVTNPTSRVRK